MQSFISRNNINVGNSTGGAHKSHLRQANLTRHGLDLAIPVAVIQSLCLANWGFQTPGMQGNSTPQETQGKGDMCLLIGSAVSLLSRAVLTPVSYRNNVRVRNVRNARNMFGPRLFGTFGQHWPKSDQNHPKSLKADMLKLGDVSFDFGFER